MRAIPDNCVDLIYLDPPFNSKTNYNILFRDGKDTAQVKAFDDKWTFEGTAHDVRVKLMGTRISDTIQGLRQILGDTGEMAYLCIMAIRLLQMHRILRDSGSIYLHCDPVMSHYLKVVMDSVFGGQNFLNEIHWRRNSAHSDGRRYGRITDIILFYSKSRSYVWNVVYTPYDEDYLNRTYRYSDGRGRYSSSDMTAESLAGGGYQYEFCGHHREWKYPEATMKRLENEGMIHRPKKAGGLPRKKTYLDAGKGVPLQDIWTDIGKVAGAEDLKYPTQKPLSLLERIIRASSNEGDVVLDPFCGCGTTVEAAAALDRQFIGIDASVEATALVKWRIKQSCGIDVKIEGLPYTIEQAERLGSTDGTEFQKWAISKMPGFIPNDKMSDDDGVDGSAKVFFDGDYHTVVVSVKGGRNPKPADLRELIGTVQKRSATFGVLVTVRPPPKKWYANAKAEGMVGDEMAEYPRIQIYTVQDIFDGKELKLPPLQPHIPSDRRTMPRRGLQKHL